MSCCTLLLIVVLLPPTQMYNEVQFSRILAPEWITRSNLALAGCYLTQGSGVRGMSYIVRSQNRDEDVICWQKMVITIMIILMVGDVIMISRSTSSKLVQFWERFPQAAWVSKTWISSLGNESRKTALWGLEKKTYFEIHHAITLLHNVNMNFVKFKVVCKMTATFWRPASREWATMGCSAMSWLLANRPQWSRRAPQDDLGDLSCGKPSFLTAILRSEWFGQEPSVNPWRGINSNSISANISFDKHTLNNGRCTYMWPEKNVAVLQNRQQGHPEGQPPWRPGINIPNIPVCRHHHSITK